MAVVVTTARVRAAGVGGSLAFAPCEKVGAVGYPVVQVECSLAIVAIAAGRVSTRVGRGLARTSGQGGAGAESNTRSHIVGASATTGIARRLLCRAGRPWRRGCVYCLGRGGLGRDYAGRADLAAGAAARPNSYGDVGRDDEALPAPAAVGPALRGVGETDVLHGALAVLARVQQDLNALVKHGAVYCLSEATQGLVAVVAFVQGTHLDGLEGCAAALVAEEIQSHRVGVNGRRGRAALGW